jgi:hypothetical protein
MIMGPNAERIIFSCSPRPECGVCASNPRRFDAANVREIFGNQHPAFAGDGTIAAHLWLECRIGYRPMAGSNEGGQTTKKAPGNAGAL